MVVLNVAGTVLVQCKIVAESSTNVLPVCILRTIQPVFQCSSNNLPLRNHSPQPSVLQTLPSSFAARIWD